MKPFLPDRAIVHGKRPLMRLLPTGVPGIHIAWCRAIRMEDLFPSMLRQLPWL
jgi:hypothetical protein